MAHPTFSVEATVLSLADRASRSLGVGRGRIEPQALIAEAERRTGRKFASRDFEPGLTRLLDACHTEADLSLFGRVALKWDCLRFLQNRLHMEAAEEADPAILDEEISAPVFVSGLPRVGSTFLHGLLAEPPENRAPLCWETIAPYPDPRDRGRDRRIERIEGQLRAFDRMVPGLSDVQPLSATAPQECTEITAHLFQSLRFDTTHRVPSYQDWLLAHGHVEAFNFHKRFLKHLQAQDRKQGGDGARRWMLKCPDHLFVLDDIETVYPDARFVFVHRDPFRVVVSVAYQTELLRSPFSRRRDRLEIGAEMIEVWARGARLMMLKCATLPPERVFHLHYDRLTADPLGAVEAMHRHFSLPLGAEAKKRVSDHVAARPRGGYSVNRYEPADYGLDPAEVRSAFTDYIEAFVEPGRAVGHAADGVAKIA